MKSINFGLLFDIFLILFGGFLFRLTAKMKRTGEPGALVLEPEEAARCKDKQGIVDAIAGKMQLFGVVTVICGGIGIINTLFFGIQWLDMTGTGVFLIVCIWFASRLRRVRDEFLK